MGSKSFRQVGVNQFTKIRAAHCRCFAPCPCFASCSCFCCHDPFIVRSAQTRPPSTGFTQLAHPSRCSRSTLTIVWFCSLIFSPGLHFSGSGASSPDPSSARHLVVECGNHGQKNTNPANLQCVVVILKQRLASFQQLCSSSLQAPS